MPYRRTPLANSDRESLFAVYTTTSYILSDVVVAKRLPMHRRAFALVLAVGLVVPLLAHASDPITGRASVIDGDTIDIHGTRIRVHGIDAPESHQTRLKGNEVVKDAAFALSGFLGARTVSCVPLVLDRHGRVVARCEVGGEDIEAWMVRNGHAVAYRRYSEDYLADEDAAKGAKRGIWRTQFQMPWDHRNLGPQKLEAIAQVRSDPDGAPSASSAKHCTHGKSCADHISLSINPVIDRSLVCLVG